MQVVQKRLMCESSISARVPTMRVLSSLFLQYWWATINNMYMWLVFLLYFVLMCFSVLGSCTKLFAYALGVNLLAVGSWTKYS